MAGDKGAQLLKFCGVGFKDVALYLDDLMRVFVFEVFYPCVANFARGLTEQKDNSGVKVSGICQRLLR